MAINNDLITQFFIFIFSFFSREHWSCHVYVQRGAPSRKGWRQAQTLHRRLEEQEMKRTSSRVYQIDPFDK